MRKISEHQHIASALHRGKKYAQLYLDIAEVILLGLDEDGYINLINRKGCRILGYDKQELIGKNWFQTCLPEKERATIFRVFREIIAGTVDFPEYFENHVLTRNGEERLIAWHNAPLQGANSEIIGTLSSGQDITEQKRTEQTLSKLSQAVEQSPDMILITDAKGNIEYVNPSFVEISGFSTADAIGKNPRVLKSGKTPASVFEQMWRTIKSGKIWRGEVCNKRKDGVYFWNLAAISPIINEQGEITHFLGIQTDITEQKQARELLQQSQKKLRTSEKRYRVCYDATPAMFFTVNTEGKIHSVNHFGASQLGYCIEELVGTPLAELHAERDQISVSEYLMTCLNKPNVVQRHEVCKVRKDGTLLWVRESARMIKDLDGEPMVLIVCEDITEARNLSKQLSHQASHDALTGLVNRREFEHRLQRVLETAHINKSEHALCYLDLDQFKVINDTCGHVAGDELLRQVAGLLQAKVRRRDTLARLGGDEFGVLMEHCSLQQATRVANILRELIEKFRFSWETKSFRVGVSIGLVSITKTSKDIAEVLSAADGACYAAKDQGRNRIHVYQQNDAQLAQWQGQMQWVAKINQALEEDRFRLYFQPIIPLERRDDKRDCYELLIRMEDKDGRLVLPGAFLPAAERYNLATKLDRWVIDTAFRWLNSHPRHLQELSLCFINLSGHSLGDPELLQFVSQQFDEMHVPSRKICFEVTETAAIANLPSATHLIRKLRQRGCQFALDDFGSGLSSFAYLKNLPVDFLKIDGLFVKDIVEDPIDMAMVRCINDIGHVMGKQIIAEFVENKAILGKLRQIGVDYAQGYGISQPKAIENIVQPE